MRVHHLAFRTRDLDRLRAFYVDVVGLRERRRHSSDDGALRSIWLEAGDTIVMLERAEFAEPAVPEATMEMVAFAVTHDERDAFRSRCTAAGVALEAETAFTTYVRDPDGRRVGCSEYRFD